MDLLEELQQKLRELDVSIKSLRKTGTAYAEAEKEYKIALRKKVLELRTEGMAVTLINIVVYGCEDVALARFKRDTTEAVYKANQEAINAIKLNIRIIESQLQREWSVA